MNKEELFYEAESKTARPHKYSIRYKHKDDTIYPSMVLRSQAEAIELLEKENQQLKKQKADVVEYLKENKVNFTCMRTTYLKCMNDLLRMLGEKDDN